MPPIDKKTPTWLPDILESVCGFRITEDYSLSAIEADVRKQMLKNAHAKIHLENKTNPDSFWSNFFLWWLDPEKKYIAPFEKQTTNDFVAKRIKSNRISQLLLAHNLQPSNPEVVKNLAILHEQGSLDENGKPLNHWQGDKRKISLGAYYFRHLEKLLKN